MKAYDLTGIEGNFVAMADIKIHNCKKCFHYLDNFKCCGNVDDKKVVFSRPEAVKECFSFKGLK